MEILDRYRLLFYALGILVLLGAWEVITLQPFNTDGKDYAWELELRNTYQDSGVTLSRSLLELYPDHADAIFLQGLQQSHLRNDFLTGCQYYKQAYQSGVTHNEDLFHYVIDCLEREQADPAMLQQVVTAWRRNYPHSRRPLRLRFADFRGIGDAMRVAAGALETSPELQVIHSKRWTDARGLIVLDVVINVSGPVLEVAPARQLLLEAGFERRPLPLDSP
ncbi:MAG: hypothetical protein VYB09_05165 [Planctomycetota bacterium]|nr:hypothetical protein [Planctomycetota bacterium]